MADGDGAPVADATVTIKTRHLEMDHGTSTDEAIATAPGRYVAEGVSMGMGGTWQTEVAVLRPGAEPAAFVFSVALEGPTHD